MIFTSIAEVEKALERLVMIASKTTGRDITTARTLEIAGLVGNPQDHLRVIHLAGTSGKTSTSYYIAGLLKAGGMKVGLTVSPHVTAITERVQINNIPLSETEFCRYMSEFLPLVTADEERLPSYFEVMMVFALWVFDKSNVDYAVVETGLGGLHDSSNICRRTDKICIITDIGVDHTHVLGDTIEKIATHKAGIIARV
jgi:dihydrofolate synthase/folylpolyglutamate synthase